jgi:predicted RNase H-like nuclease (RuvC/YqgF family)
VSLRLLVKLSLTVAQALTTFEKLAEQATAVEAKALSHDLAFQDALQSSLRHERDYLERENERLAKQNEQLQNIVATREAELAQFSNNLLQGLQNQLSAFKASQSAALRADIEPVQRELEEGQEARRKHVKKRTASLAGMQDFFGSTISCYREAWEDVQDAALDQVKVRSLVA